MYYMEETTKVSKKYIKTKKIRIKDGAQLVSAAYSMPVFPREYVQLTFKQVVFF